MTSPEVTEDTMLGGQVRIVQPKVGYRAAIDPVLLAAAVKGKARDRVLDVGCGTGAAMFCLAARIPGIDVSGLERQPDLAALAQASIKLNAFETRARVVVGDLSTLPDIICAAPFDIVISNPPFGSDGPPSPQPSIAAAHHESDMNLTQWIGACLKLLKPKGRFLLIHRADRLGEIMSALRPGCGDIHITPLFPKKGEPAKRVIIDAGKGRNTGDTINPGLVLHTATGAFTVEAETILRGAAGL